MRRIRPAVDRRPRRPLPAPPRCRRRAGYHAPRHHARDRSCPELNVTVTRTTEPLARVPFATGVLDRTALQRGQQTVGIDEALNNLPGVVVANRYNFSLDQRISIRGFGSRSNFGVRGSRSCWTAFPRRCPTARASSPTSTSATSSAPKCCAAPARRSTATPPAA